MKKFGGQWTKDKLEALDSYVTFYLTALKNQSFYKIYIDCFAGCGNINLPNGETIVGSVNIVLNNDLKFDEYIFIEKMKSNCIKLEQIRKKHPELNIIIINADCNAALPQLIQSYNWKKTRGILFLDPYATQTPFSSLQLIANTRALDVWYLFPFGAVNRLLKHDGNINDDWRIILDKVLGTDNWLEDLYKENIQLNIFGDLDLEKTEPEKVRNYIYKRLSTVFPYVSKNYLVLKNKKNSPLFLLFLMISNESNSAIRLVKKVENYILKE